jgi:DNA (cytosine-5)-methyltransferase 1
MTTPQDNDEPSVASIGSKPLTFGSLFAGIGGFDLGLESAGMRCLWQVERDEYAANVLAKNFPGVERWRDVETFPPIGGDWSVDVICAGPPCQPISSAGHRKGCQDERWMWGECLRIVATLKPSVFVAENPTNLLNDDRGRTFRGIVGALSAVGYCVEWHVIPASAVGAPHRRNRVWIVAYSDEQRRRWGDTPEALQGVGEAGEESAGGGEPRRRRRHSMAATTGLGDRIRRELEAPSGVQGMLGAARVHWATEPGVGRVADGFPSRVDRLRCLGNAAVPQVVRAIGRTIVTGARA